MIRKIWTLLKNYPLPLIALTGLISGLIVYFGLKDKQISEWIWLATICVAGAPIVFNTLKGIFKGEFASDIVAMLAIITALIMQEAFAGAVVVLMQSGGEALEKYGMRRASSSLEKLLERAPRIALKKQNEALIRIDVKDVAINDLLVVRPGDLIPVDGTIVSGSAEIDESALTGEPLARNKTVGDQIFSGTIDVNGAIEMRADRTSKESQYQKIVDLVRKAQMGKAPIQRLADKYAIFFTPLALIMSLIGFLITQNTTTILSVLVVATPCPLILATPLAILCGINLSAKNSIIIKGGAPMEEIGKTKAAIFDKTGTITYGTPFVEEIVPLNHEKPDELLKNSAAIEQLSTHSIAKAVVEKAQGSFPKAQNFKESPGKGVEADIGSDHYTIGSHSFLKEKFGDECYKNCEEAIEQHRKQKLLVFIAKNNLCVGIFVISDKIRSNIPQMVQKLHALGVEEIVMLTGDGAKNAELIAKQAGIEKIEADLTPEEKVQSVQKIKERFGHVTMIGDGINDAPALATATVGVAMGALGSAISAEAADVVLLVDDVTKVSDAISYSQLTLYIAKMSIFIGIGLSFLLMVIAAFGYIQPAVGALLQEIIDVAVILNALRVR